MLKFLSYEKLAMTSQFDLTRFYVVIIRNSVFQLGNSRSLSELLIFGKLLIQNFTVLLISDNTVNSLNFVFSDDGFPDNDLDR